LSVNELLRAKPKHLLITLMQKDLVKIYADLRLSDIKNHSEWLHIPVLPVVDRENILLGKLEYHLIRRFEESSTKDRIPRHLIATSGALGELYRIGMTSLLQGASTYINNLKNNHE
jgi:hypothetical protein